MAQRARGLSEREPSEREPSKREPSEHEPSANAGETRALWRESMGPASVSPATEGGSNVSGMRVGRQSWVGRSIVGRTLVGRTFVWVQWPCGGIGGADFRSWIPRAVGIPGLNACEDLVVRGGCSVFVFRRGGLLQPLPLEGGGCYNPPLGCNN